MDKEYEWGDWIEYSGGYAGKKGEYVQHVWSTGYNIELAMSEGWHVVSVNTTERILPWDYRPKVGDRYVKLIRYRIRRHRSKAMDILRAICLHPTAPLRELTPA